MYQEYLTSPLGIIRIEATQKGVSGIDIVKKRGEKKRNEHTKKCVKQLKEYFAGKRTEFDLSFDVSGTDFQKAVWKQIGLIPFGKTRTYGEIAKRLKRPGASRAVGAACGKNPLWLIVPCHRVIGSNGKLTGYAGGLSRKKQLLDFESK